MSSNILIHQLPQTVAICGYDVPIETDFRTWLEFETILQTDDEKRGLKAINIVFKQGVPRGATSEDITIAILWFFEGGKTANDSNVSKENTKSFERIYDVSHDAELIYAAFWQAYNIDLYNVNFHWWQYKALFNGLPENCKFSQIVRIRGMEIPDDASVKTKEKYKKLKRQYALPLPVSEQAKQNAIEEALMNGGDVAGVI